MPHGRRTGCRVLHDRDLTGELGEQPDGAMDDVVDIDCPGQETRDRPSFGARQWLDGRQPVHKQPVALVRGDAPGAGVWLGEIALLLQDRHVVTDGRRGDIQAVTLYQGLRADRLAGGHVIGDDGAEHSQLPVVHRSPLLGRWHSTIPSAKLTPRAGGRQSMGLRRIPASGHVVGQPGIGRRTDRLNTLAARAVAPAVDLDGRAAQLAHHQ